MQMSPCNFIIYLIRNHRNLVISGFFCSVHIAVERENYFKFVFIMISCPEFKKENVTAVQQKQGHKFGFYLMKMSNSSIIQRLQFNV